MLTYSNFIQSIYKNITANDWFDQRFTANILSLYTVILILFPGILFFYNCVPGESMKALIGVFSYIFFHLSLSHSAIGVHEILDDYLHNLAMKSSALLISEIFFLLTFNLIFFFFFV